MQRHLLLALLVRCSLDLPSPLMLAVTFWRLWVVTNVTTDKQAFLVLEVVWCVDKTPGCSVMPILRGVMILQVVVMVQMMMLWVVVMLQVMVMLQVIVILVSLMKAQGHGRRGSRPKADHGRSSGASTKRQTELCPNPQEDSLTSYTFYMMPCLLSEGNARIDSSPDTVHSRETLYERQEPSPVCQGPDT